ncbi:hypothetical protein QQ045_031786 [Rhodiola kirilowii]
MASASPMAIQLRTSFTANRVLGAAAPPKGLAGSSFNHLPCRKVSTFTIKAIQSEKPTYQVVQPINEDPFVGSLEIPVTSSPLVAWYLSNLPAYRTAVSPLLCGVEVGLAHGYEGELSIAPALTLTGRKKTPDQLHTAEGWAKFTGGDTARLHPYRIGFMGTPYQPCRSYIPIQQWPVPFMGRWPYRPKPMEMKH